MVAILAAGVWAFASLQADKNERNTLIETGLRADGISTGKVYTYEPMSKKRQTVYKAWYSYTRTDGVKSTVIGDKEYDSADDIREGMKAIVHYYEDGSETATTNEE